MDSGQAELCQASAPALTPAELAVLEQDGFVISSHHLLPTFLRGHAAIYSEDHRSDDGRRR